jgi:hemerythrin superfamily protein
MDALVFLKDDHQKVKRLFKQIAGTDDPAKRQALFDQIDTELEIHAHIEETIFYPVLENYEELKDMVEDAWDEHAQLKALLGELEKLDIQSETFAEELTALIETVEHHVEEEEDELFPAVREIIAASMLEDLAKQLAAAKGRPQGHVDVETFRP